ncbi:MAG: DUF3098 domain-containing protein [Bacteroidetes bacterium]|nr:DUF3098 domain-containing protein [Bacteroidota bacterium]MBV6460800.1 hypothetical protein [Flavobacteriales bacterium]WKZ75801.1 MAG: DUF3098 domain-containing protein [Vicingaceae bacterium]MCL4816655.1 DUF3098 domain-containing protein [Flavobacteriales bacterium]NOG95698.1 DUF3098 domain-containing protein [Bacteroidota bacterium]
MAKTNQLLPFNKENYLYIGIGFLLCIIGYLLMVGGGSEDPVIYNPEVFSFRRITLSPILIIAGFIVVIYGIMKKPKE